MKEQILGYLTAVSNSYEKIDMCCGSAVIQDLSNLSDFVADFKENSNDEIETLNYQIFNYKKDIKIWIESYNTLAKENIKLNTTLEQTEKDLCGKDVKEENLRRDCIKLNKDNRMWQETCNNLKDELAKLRGPQWIK